MRRTIGTPEGTRDRLFSECAACRQVEQAATKLFRRRGYWELTTPNVEYYDIIPAAGHPLSQEAMVKCVERTGKLLVLRPDNTVAIGRVAATKLSSMSLPLRLYYNQTVFRSDDIHTGARTEIDQCGVELIGAEGLRADLEMLSMAIDALEACGVKDYHMEIGHVAFFSALLGELGAEPVECSRLRRCVEQKNYVAYRQLLKKWRDTPAGNALWNLPRLFGGVEVLERARGLTTQPEAQNAISYLQNIYEVLDQAGLSGHVQFDLGLIQNMEYYTGMIFRGFVQGAGSNVISGGRYDRLIGQFGKEIPATGFGLDVEAVAGCLTGPECAKPETLIWYDLGSLREARAALEELPDQTAMLSSGETPEAAETEAKQLGASRLVLIDAAGKREVQL